MYYQIANSQAVEATLPNTSNPQTWIAAQSQAWRHERDIYSRLIEGAVTEPTASPDQDAIIVPYAIAQHPVIDPRIIELREQYADLTRALCGLLALPPVPVLSLAKISTAAETVTDAATKTTGLKIALMLSNLEMKLCMADGPDALERVV